MKSAAMVLGRALVLLVVALCTAFPAQAAWQWAGASSTGSTINQLIKAGGQYVAVGTQGLIQTSSDGNAWVTRNSGVTGELRGVAYGNGIFVVVGDSAILSSVDGATWTITASDSATTFLNLYAVTFGNGRFVAVGQSGTLGPVYTSTDGKTWAGVLADSRDSLTSVGYANGLFVIGGNSIETSTDGIHWTRVQTVRAFFSAVAYGAGTWVVTADPFNDTEMVFTSKDGATWTQGSLGQRATIYAVIYDGTRFVALGQNGFQILGQTASEFTSSDGITWTPVVYGPTQPISRFTQMHSLIQADGRYLATGADGTIVYSTDAVRWATVYPYMPTTVNAIAYGNGRFVAVAKTYALTSVDGVHWTYVFTGFPNSNLLGVTFGNGRFVAVGENQFMYSTDGLSWSSAVTPRLTTLYSVVFANGQFYGVGTSVYSSTDGLAWQKLSDPASGWWTHVRYINGVFFAVDSSGQLYRSSDAISWTADPAFAGRSVKDIAYHDGVWVVTGTSTAKTDGTYQNAIRTSTDSVTWTDMSPPTFLVLYTVTWNHGRWITVGYGVNSASIVATSVDGKAWTLTALPMGIPQDFAGNDDVEVAVGDGIARNVFYADTSGAPSEIRNISVRAVASGAPVIMGFAANTAGSVLLRGVGPTLGQFGVGDAAPAVSLTHYGAGETRLASNDGWAGDPALTAAFHQVGAFDLQSASSKDAALISVAPAGDSTVHANATAPGVLLEEAYAMNTTTHFTNLSARNEVGSGADVLILGFSVSGGQDKRVLIRVIGPTLKQYGVTDALDNVQLQLWQGDKLLTTNTTWGGFPAIAGAFSLAGAFQLDPNANDAAIVTTLTPGSYTVIASAANAASGSALAEVYELP